MWLISSSTHPSCLKVKKVVLKKKIEGKDFCIVNAEANRNGSLHEFNREDELKVHSGNTKSDDLLCAWLGYVFLDYVWDVKLNQWFANRQNEGKRGWFHAFLFYISDSANRLRLYKWVFGKDADKSFNLWEKMEICISQKII